MCAEREMTLAEWVARLPANHRANKEYAQLLEACKELREHLAMGPLDFAAQYGDTADPDVISEAVARRADAAIAAAEGGSTP
jgi:hypothetical protein